jgi:phenylacetate-CoA ligase
MPARRPISASRPGKLDAPLSALPVLTKAELMEHFDELVTAPDVRLGAVEEYLAGLRGNELFRGRYYVCATAGTTGRRGVFVWNFSEWIDILTSYNRVYEWGGAVASLTRRISSAVVSSTNPSHQSARVGRRSTAGGCRRCGSIRGMSWGASSPGSTAGSRAL